MLSRPALADEPPVRLYPAGSLTAAMTEMARAFTAAGRSAVTTAQHGFTPVPTP